VIKCFREHSQAPILSLLRPGQDKLPEADFAVEAFNPADFVQAVQTILAAKLLIRAPSGKRLFKCPVVVASFAYVSEWQP
jgi:hypothetical protein